MVSPPLSDVSHCLELQTAHGLPSLTLLRTANMSLAIAAVLTDVFLSIRSHPSSLASLYHRDGLPGVCSRGKKLDMYVSAYQMLPAAALSVDVGNITSGKLGQL